MKLLPSLFIVLAFLTMSLSVQAQQKTSPRTGNRTQIQILSMAEFNNMPAELQKLVKENPHLYQIKDTRSDIVVISTVDLAKLPQDKQNFILAHPELYKVEDESNASQKTSPSTEKSSN